MNQRRIRSNRSKKSKSQGRKRSLARTGGGRRRNPSVENEKPNYGFIDPERTDDKAQGEDQPRLPQGEFEQSRDIQTSSDQPVNRGSAEERDVQDIETDESDVVGRGKSADVEGEGEGGVEGGGEMRPLHPDEDDDARRRNRRGKDPDYTPE